MLIRRRKYEVTYLPETGAEARTMIIAADAPLSPDQVFSLLRQMRRNPATGDPLNVRKVLTVEAVSAPGLAATA
jgi:hypothetical protein